MKRILGEILGWSLLVIIFLAGMVLTGRAEAHEWYSKRSDPVLRLSCCGGHDCAPFKVKVGKNLIPEHNGYRIILSLEEAKLINPKAKAPINTLVIWERVQESETNDFNLCISETYRGPPHYGVYCFFQPGNG